MGKSVRSGLVLYRHLGSDSGTGRHSKHRPGTLDGGYEFFIGTDHILPGCGVLVLIAVCLCTSVNLVDGLTGIHLVE